MYLKYRKGVEVWISTMEFIMAIFQATFLIYSTKGDDIPDDDPFVLLTMHVEYPFQDCFID